MDVLTFKPGYLQLSDIKQVIDNINVPHRIDIQGDYKTHMAESRQMLDDLINQGQIIYGVNTGFGKLADQVISSENLSKLQYNLLRSHAVGTGSALSSEVVKLIQLQC